MTTNHDEGEQVIAELGTFYAAAAAEASTGETCSEGGCFGAGIR